MPSEAERLAGEKVIVGDTVRMILPEWAERQIENRGYFAMDRVKQSIPNTLPDLLAYWKSERRMFQAYWTHCMTPEEERVIEEAFPWERRVGMKPVGREFHERG